jgi:hypothetical protein
MGNNLKIICDGDSWVFGCEIVDPNVENKYGLPNKHPGEYDYFIENDKYRIERIFPTYLGELLNAEVENISWPADDNGTIINRTLTHLASNYISKGESTDNLLVIIGWSSPERNSFWYKDDKLSMRFRLWPNVEQFQTKEQKEFWKLYVNYLWNVEDYIPRYVMNVIQLQNFCNQHNIKWLCFNSFYQTPNTSSPKEWKDINVKEELKIMKNFGLLHDYTLTLSDKRKNKLYEYVSLWDTIDEKRFYKKDQPNNSFKQFMEINNPENTYVGWHPSPSSHKVWANELYKYIIENKII